MPSAPRNEHGIADFVMHGGYATIAASPAAIIIFFIAVFPSLTIGIGLGNIFTLATFPSPPTQSGEGQVDSYKWLHCASDQVEIDILD